MEDKPVRFEPKFSKEKTERYKFNKAGNQMEITPVDKHGNKTYFTTCIRNDLWDAIVEHVKRVEM